MSWKKRIFGDPDTMNLDKMKSGVYGIFIFVSLIFIGFIVLGVLDYYDDGTVTIPVRATLASKTDVPYSVKTTYGEFLTSYGDLEYKAPNAWTVLLYQEFGGLDIFKLLYFLVILYAIVRCLKDIADNNVFTRKIQNAFYFVGIFTFIYYAIIFQFIIMLKTKIIADQTGYAFSFKAYLDQIPYIIFGSIIMMCGFFLKKGKELQQDQDLTI